MGCSSSAASRRRSGSSASSSDWFSSARLRPCSGDLFLAGIVDREPALLIALNPRNRNLALATNQLSALTYYLVGFTRLVVSDPLYYLLGFWYGDRAIAWTERRSRTYGPLIRDGERIFRRSSYPFIFLAPNNIICALSAATGVRLRTFIALNLSGTVVRLILVRWVGEIFRPGIDSILDFIAEYRIPLLILSAIGVAWTVFGEFRGNNSELSGLLELGDDEDATATANRAAATPATAKPATATPATRQPATSTPATSRTTDRSSLLAIRRRSPVASL